MKKFLVALALLLGVLFLLTQFAQLHEVFSVLQRGNIFFLLLALMIEAAWILNLGAFYQSIYHVLGMDEKHLHVTKLVTAGYFLTVVVPSAGLGAMAVYITDAKHNGRSIAKVTVASVLYVWFELIGTAGVLVLGLAELARRNTLHWSEIAASLFLVAGALGIGLLLYLGMQSPRSLGKVLAFLTGMVNGVVKPFIHRGYLSEERAYIFSDEIAEGITALRSNPGWVAWPLLFTLINKALLVGVLACCFLAFQVELDLGTAIAGQSLAHLFLIVSPTPAGIGVVEGVLAVALRSLGLPLGDATVVTLAYRGFSFWTPFLTGMVTLRMLSGQKRLEHLPNPSK